MLVKGPCFSNIVWTVFPLSYSKERQPKLYRIPGNYALYGAIIQRSVGLEQQYTKYVHWSWYWQTAELSGLDVSQASLCRDSFHGFANGRYLPRVCHCYWYYSAQWGKTGPYFRTNAFSNVFFWMRGISFLILWSLLNIVPRDLGI